MCVGELLTAFVDHNHTSGAVRALLCAGCNSGLGFIEKDGFVEAARRYLEDYDG